MDDAIYCVQAKTAKKSSHNIKILNTIMPMLIKQV